MYPDSKPRRFLRFAHSVCFSRNDMFYPRARASTPPLCHAEQRADIVGMQYKRERALSRHLPNLATVWRRDPSLPLRMTKRNILLKFSPSPSTCSRMQTPPHNDGEAILWCKVYLNRFRGAFSVSHTPCASVEMTKYKEGGARPIGRPSPCPVCHTEQRTQQAGFLIR